MRIACHQPGLLPWAGFWNKYYEADYMMLMGGVQFCQRDYQNRVRLNAYWLTLPVEGHQSRALIRDVKVSDPKRAMRLLANTLKHNFPPRKMKFAGRLDPLMSYVTKETHPTSLVEILVDLLVITAKMLSLPEKFLYFGDELPDLTGSQKIAHMVSKVGGTTYLSGTSGPDYMKPDDFGGIDVLVQKLMPDVPNETILQLIAREESPLTHIVGAAEWKRWNREVPDEVVGDSPAL